jgi:RNA polymerase sigma factor (sigma-70 family)
MPVSAPQRPAPSARTRQAFLTAATTPDASLVALAAGGDERAFELLFQRHRTDVLAYATRMLRDHGRAEDVVQDVFVSAMRAIVGAPADRHPVHVRAWLREIARRACIDQWRGATRRGEVSLDAPERLLAGDALRLADDDSLTRATDDREAVATLRRAFDDLPELQHAVLVQRELEGRSIAEIAARLELTPTVVEGQLARGRRALGQAYRELESGERCVAVRALCDASLGGRLGVRDRHRVGRHVHGCDGCRRYARQSGVDPRLVDRALLSRASFLLPLPLLRRLPVDHTMAGETAGGILGAKVLVGAAVIAAGGGSVYVTNADVPLPLSPKAPASSPAGDAPSDLGVRPGPGGVPVVRVPGGSRLTATVVLPGTAAGLRDAHSFLPPWSTASDEPVRAPRAATDAAPPTPADPTDAAPADAAPAAPAPAAVVPAPPAPGPEAGTTAAPSRPASPAPAATAPPSRDVPLTPPTAAEPPESGPARAPDPSPAPASPEPTAEVPAAPTTSADDTPASVEAPVQQQDPAPADPAPAPDAAPVSSGDDAAPAPADATPDAAPADVPAATAPETEPAAVVEVPAGAALGGS